MNIFKNSQRLVFTCIDSRRQTVADELMKDLNAPRPLPDSPWLRFLAKEEPFRAQEWEVDFGFVNNGVSQPGIAPRRCILWAPRCKPDSTVFINNIDDGLEHAFDKLSKRVNWRIVIVAIFDDPANEFPGFSFYYYENHQKTKRLLAAIRDIDEWVFVNEGALLPFENPQHYQARLKRDRLNRAIIAAYLSAIGHDVARDDFWETDEVATYIWAR
jgi:hypothetical protein